MSNEIGVTLVGDDLSGEVSNFMGLQVHADQQKMAEIAVKEQASKFGRYYAFGKL